ncbi:M23 family metallopeptidase [Clostridium tetani]|uniref:M23 family peptidase n=1 Tax=Clostridium tetani TaxID=1513 RepID=A0ABY0EQI0_CLOTA|nr:M23 family metallopeptidase [Clostridium tetani]CDI50252.1 cell wall endopeptidase [Clostridium tetani 12124569]KHO38139.1 peptidase M23 [Clostridium tetani]RXI40402.1 M23 family peptidase [Clostridium tetani]RXI53556.1 M23 family peptidase [Clostridium tetani]RXI66817.1 M23 family peptidase [Clostridium tetani]
MSGYNSQYEEYYKGLRNGKGGNFDFYRGATNGNRKRKPKSIWDKFIKQLIGTAVLFSIVILCKLIVTPETKAFYNYSKEIVNKNYDYKKIYSKINTIQFKDLEDELIGYIEKIKKKTTGKQTIMEKTKENFIVPIKGSITSNYGYREDPIEKNKVFHYGIDIDAKENTEVLSSYNGKIKDLGEDTTLGKYILVDHGDGIETKYGHLNKINVKKGQTIEKGHVIGHSGNTGKSTAPHLHFELMYMGDNKDPKEFIEIK